MTVPKKTIQIGCGCCNEKLMGDNDILFATETQSLLLHDGHWYLNGKQTDVPFPKNGEKIIREVFEDFRRWYLTSAPVRFESARNGGVRGDAVGNETG